MKETAQEYVTRREQMIKSLTGWLAESNGTLEILLEIIERTPYQGTSGMVKLTAQAARQELERIKAEFVAEMLEPEDKEILKNN
jgi:hypothetical protein